MVKILLDDAVEEMLFNDEARGLSKNTIGKHRKYLGMFTRFLNSIQINYIDEVEPRDIKKFMIKKFHEGSAESYVNSFLRSIRALFLYCENEEYISFKDSPTKNVKWMKEEKKAIRTFTNDEVKSILKYCNVQTKKGVKKKSRENAGLLTKFTRERDYLLVLLLVDTGMRISEALNLKMEDIQNDEISIKRAKGKKGRIMYISSILQKQIMKYERAKKMYFDTKDFDVSEHLFINKNGNKYARDMSERDIKRICDGCGIDNDNIQKIPHGFRHFFAQNLVINKVNIYVIQRLLGHSSIKTTEIYLNSLNYKEVIKIGKENSPLKNLR